MTGRIWRPREGERVSGRTAAPPVPAFCAPPSARSSEQLSRPVNPRPRGAPAPAKTPPLTDGEDDDAPKPLLHWTRGHQIHVHVCASSCKYVSDRIGVASAVTVKGVSFLVQKAFSVVQTLL